MRQKMDPELIPLAVTAAVVILTLTVVATVLRKKGRRLAERLAPAFELGTSRPAGPLGTGVDGLGVGPQLCAAQQAIGRGVDLQVSSDR